MFFTKILNRNILLPSIQKCLTRRQDYCIKKSIKAYSDFNIIPDVFDEAPSGRLQVQFKNGIDVNYGTVLQPKDVLEPPILQWEHDTKKYYTICMIDPDHPSKEEPILRSFQVWFVGNISGQRTESGETFAGYVGAGPPKNTGYHRYVIFICEQKDKIDYSKLIQGKYMLPRYRNNFCYREFSRTYDLGMPIAGNFFLAKYDSTVPKVYKKLQHLTSNWNT